MRRIKFYHIIFAASVLALIALSIWWFALHRQQVELVYKGQVESLTLRSQLEAHHLGARPADSDAPELPADSPFLLQKSTRPGEHDEGHLLAPNWKEWSLQLKPEVAARIEEKHHRRLVMVYGEGSMLILLTLVCVVMLFYLLWVEKRTRDEMDTFFHAVSHELKTPLAGLRALLQTVSTRKLDETELHRYSRLGLKEISRLQSLIDNVLLANRLDRKKFKAGLHQINIVSEVEHFLKRRLDIFDRQEVELTVECEADSLAVADPALLRNVLENLISNAYKYSTSDVRVSVRLHQDAEWCMIDVTDDGSGLRPGEQEEIFEKFQRGSSGMISKKEGFGLGLFIARELVHMFGGQLNAQSDGPGEGSCFSIRLRREME